MPGRLGHRQRPADPALRLQRPGQPTLQPQLTRHVAGGRTATGGIFNGNGHDYVTAADRYGLIIVLPEATRSGNCFDVSTPAALRRNGGSDSTGIMSMVAYARPGRARARR
ncbi:hypothetical protein GCM10009827_114510 [Dactylosporangium maewongense]|uniref:Uncharacterized protein n=1 Tax=Dactylosporangium maewongense TaxID=634393 RepID=A0ABP4P872_9ACTN